MTGNVLLGHPRAALAPGRLVVVSMLADAAMR
jgi:hypothetical protein